MPPPLMALPIDEALPAIVRAVALRRTCVVEATPGAGKTTRVPRALFDAGLAERGTIVVLEPRRLAARLAATRVASELGEKPGATVGYQVRYDSRTSAATRIVFMTEGVLTRRLVADPTLRGVACVVLDELHERHLHTDLALALLRQRQRTTRPDLALVAMSATLDGEAVAAFLGDESGPASRIVSEARQHPVTVEYAPPPPREPLELAIASAVRRLGKDGLDGHVLVFLPGASEIRRAARACAAAARSLGLVIRPLHGSLSPAEQDAAVAPSRELKLILATNVAESSLTIPGVTAVIDSGFAKVVSQAPGSPIAALRTERISRASAEQRAGRAGRTAPGRAIRLFSEADHLRQPSFAAPEITRTDLTELVLAARVAGDDPLLLPWLTPPSIEALASAARLLADLGAFDARDARDPCENLVELTPLGRELARLPVHPRIARTLLEAKARGVVHAATLAAAILEEGGRLRRRSQSDAQLSANLWDDCERYGDAELRGFEHHALDELGLDAGAVHATRRAREQLARLMKTHEDEDYGDPERDLALALLAGFPDLVCKRAGTADRGGIGVTLASGGSATIQDPSAIGGDGCLLALDAQEGERGQPTRISLAIPLSADWLLEAFGTQVVAESELELDPRTGRVMSTDRLRYRALILEESRTTASPSRETARILLAAAEKSGLFAQDALVRLERRSAHASRSSGPGHAPSGSITLSSAIRLAFEAACENCVSLDELRALPLAHTVLAGLAPSDRRALDERAPERLRLPSGRELEIHYPPDAPPYLESYLQDFFGQRETPRIGSVNAVLHLWAPSKRPLQVTSDLASFWRGQYPELRRALMRRYPKHHWPEDGAAASAVRFKRDG